MDGGPGRLEMTVPADESLDFKEVLVEPALKVPLLEGSKEGGADKLPLETMEPAPSAVKVVVGTP